MQRRKAGKDAEMKFIVYHAGTGVLVARFATAGECEDWIVQLGVSERYKADNYRVLPEDVYYSRRYRNCLTSR